MRVIGVEFAPPVASPGATVRARAVIVDVEDRPVDVRWFRCQRLLLDPTAVPVVSETDLGGVSSRIFENCFGQGVTARGVEAAITVDAEGGSFDDVRTRAARRWTDLIGVACAGGSVELPSHALEWPRCRGGPAFVFVASIPGPGPAGPLRQVPPPRITEIEIVRVGFYARLGEAEATRIRRCRPQDECKYQFLVRVEGSPSYVMPTVGTSSNLTRVRDGLAVGWLASAGSRQQLPGVCWDDRIAFVNTAPAIWVPPDEPGEVRFWFWVTDPVGGMTWTQRTLLVD